MNYQSKIKKSTPCFFIIGHYWR